MTAAAALVYMVVVAPVAVTAAHLLVLIITALVAEPSALYGPEV